MLNYLEQSLGQGKAHRDEWYRHWIDETFTALEQLLMTTAGIYCVGNEVTLADCMLVPQVYNARRYDMSLEDYPTINRIVANCEQLRRLSRPRQSSSRMPSLTYGRPGPVIPVRPAVFTLPTPSLPVRLRAFRCSHSAESRAARPVAGSSRSRRQRRTIIGRLQPAVDRQPDGNVRQREVRTGHISPVA